MRPKKAEIEDLLGVTLVAIRGDLVEEIVFETFGGRVYRMHHEQDCCESVLVEDICGDMEDLIGVPIVEAEEVTKCDDAPKVDDSGMWTFYKLRTSKGAVTIRWYGSSNGYYSESVDFDLVVEP